RPNHSRHASPHRSREVNDRQGRRLCEGGAESPESIIAGFKQLQITKPAIPTTTVDQFITGLCGIPEEEFRVGTVYDYLKQHPVDEESLQPYLFFSRMQYTRNLIFKNDLFELMA